MQQLLVLYGLRTKRRYHRTRTSAHPGYQSRNSRYFQIKNVEDYFWFDAWQHCHALRSHRLSTACIQQRFVAPKNQCKHLTRHRTSRSLFAVASSLVSDALRQPFHVRIVHKIQAVRKAAETRALRLLCGLVVLFPSPVQLLPYGELNFVCVTTMRLQYLSRL